MEEGLVCEEADGPDLEFESEGRRIVPSLDKAEVVRERSLEKTDRD